MAKRVPKKVKEIREYVLKQESGAKNISFSQLSVYLNCPKCWERAYLRKEQAYEPSIHTAFGTAMHETIQEWLDTLYNDSVKAATAKDLHKELEAKLRKVYLAEKKKCGKDFSDAQTLSEFYEDGIAILDYIVKHRKGVLPETRSTWLVGCEIPIYVKLQEKFYFKGFIDVLTYDEVDDKWKIWDIKTSTKGWRDEKSDFVKVSQILLYKEFLSRQFDIPIEKIDAEYFVVKRKIFEEAEYASMKKRVQEFIPNDGPRIHKKVVGQITQFLSDAVDSTGEYIDKDYPKNPTLKNCKYCVFQDSCPGAKAVL